MKLALMGASGSGKDFIVDYLVLEHNYRRFSFSDQLKKITHSIFPWFQIDYPPLEKENPLNIVLDSGDTIESSPREIWLKMNFLREIENKIFIRMLQDEITSYINSSTTRFENNVIISDLRTTDELLWCKNNNFTIIYIKPQKIIYQTYDFDKEILKNRKAANFEFVNDFNGIDGFKEFYRTRLLP